MKQIIQRVAIGLVLGASTVTISFAGQGAAAGSCDKPCLNGIADRYLAALVAHDPAKAPMAPNAKFTEQAKALAVGEGLWKSAVEGPTTFKIPVADPVAGQIGLILMMKASASAFPAPPGRGGTAARGRQRSRQHPARAAAEGAEPADHGGRAHHRAHQRAEPAQRAEDAARGVLADRAARRAQHPRRSCSSSPTRTTTRSCSATASSCRLPTTAAAARTACTRPAPAVPPTRRRHPPGSAVRRPTAPGS